MAGTSQERLDMFLTAWAMKSVSKHIPVPCGELWWHLAFDAREFAQAEHATQVRTGTTLPYFTHLAEAAYITGAFHAMGLISDAEFKIALQSAWLHDVVEDRGVAIASIHDRFGQQTSQAVSALTKRKRCAENPKPMDDSLVRIKTSGKIACLVKAADRISNLSGPPPPTWSSDKVLRYGQEGFHIAGTLSPVLPMEAIDMLNLISGAYLKSWGDAPSPSRGTKL